MGCIIDVQFQFRNVKIMCADYRFGTEVSESEPLHADFPSAFSYWRGTRGETPQQISYGIVSAHSATSYAVGEDDPKRTASSPTSTVDAGGCSGGPRFTIHMSMQIEPTTGRRLPATRTEARPEHRRG